MKSIACITLGLAAALALAVPVNLAAQVGFDVFSFASQIEVGGYVVATAHQVNLGRQHILQALLLAHDLLRLLWVRPQTWVSRLLLDFG